MKQKPTILSIKLWIASIESIPLNSSFRQA